MAPVVVIPPGTIQNCCSGLELLTLQQEELEKALESHNPGSSDSRSGGTQVGGEGRACLAEVLLEGS